MLDSIVEQAVRALVLRARTEFAGAGVERDTEGRIVGVGAEESVDVVLKNDIARLVERDETVDNVCVVVAAGNGKDCTFVSVDLRERSW
jgi:hypothetical protein